jgi:hypothetical protein
MPDASARGRPEPAALIGRTEPWSEGAKALLFLLCIVGLAFRLSHLSAEGFADDEVHKWNAVTRYLTGDFGGDDVEHPMLMKWLIALCMLIGRPLAWAPETMTRLPNALAGGVSILAIAMLGRRLFGNIAGLFAAGLASLCCTFIGYQRVAKEDTLLGLFIILLCWCLAEAKAAADDADAGIALRANDQRRWEIFGALSLAGMLASKYFAWHALIAPIFVLSMRSQSAWRISWKRWLQLGGIAFLAWLCVNWSPFLPSTWAYARSYTSGQQTVHGSLFFMGHIFHNLVEYGWNGTPPWFYAVFTAVKLSPGTFVLAMIGVGLAFYRRQPAHKLLFAWMGVWFFIHSLSGSKWGRFYVSVLPAFLLLAGYAAVFLAGRFAAFQKPLGHKSSVPGKTYIDQHRWETAIAILGLLSIGGEARATVQHEPHERLYISILGGGDANVDWFFPHCDYFDAGFREAVQYVDSHAEQGAELSTEIELPARLYSHRAGRDDLLQTLNRRGRACRAGKICYVVVQTGRWYFLNEDSVNSLATKTPWHVEQIRDRDVVKVYRLPPGESPFPDENK